MLTRVRLGLWAVTAALAASAVTSIILADAPRAPRLSIETVAGDVDRPMLSFKLGHRGDSASE